MTRGLAKNYRSTANIIEFLEAENAILSSQIAAYKLLRYPQKIKMISDKELYFMSDQYKLGVEHDIRKSIDIDAAFICGARWLAKKALRKK